MIKPGMRTLNKIVFAMVVVPSLFVLNPAKSHAGAPEYMQLKAQPGVALEIEGAWDPQGLVFVAHDIEILPKERLPKLRGAIQDFNSVDSVITMCGRKIRIYDHTEFIDDGGEHVNFQSLKKGMRIEVSCKFGDNGEWKARKIKTKDVKDSDKIKGTITRVAIDGKAPDTLFMEGLPILLRDETDILEPSGGSGAIEKELFPDIKLADMTVPASPIVLNHQMFLNVEYRQSVTSEQEFDLSKYFDTDFQETEPAVRLEFTAFANEKFQAFAQARVKKRYYISSDQDNPPRHKLDADLTQLYILGRNIGFKGLAVQVGRQDFDEEREWLYDDYLDAVRLYYYGRSPFVFETAYIHAVSPLKTEFKTWTDILLQAHVFADKDNHISSYFIMRKDTSLRNREPQWYGIRYNGKLLNFIRPRVELALMTGEDKGRALKANAYDLGATIQSKSLRFQPSLTLGYAFGSGDKVSGDNTDNRFRQTGYEDNVSYFGGIAPIHYYSEVLDPELSNIKVLTFAGGIRPTGNSSVDLIYHTFQQERPKDELTGGNLMDPPARPNGVSNDLGREIDAVLGINGLFNHLSLSWTIGYFNPGKAYDPFLENALLNRLNLKLYL